MITVPLAPGLAASSSARTFKPWWFGYWATVVLLVASAIGAIVWATVASPFAFKHLRQSVLNDSVNLVRNDTYYVYEVGKGVTATNLPAPVAISIREVRGTDVRVTMLSPPGVPVDAPTIRTPIHEARAVASFTVTRPGNYDVLVTELAEGSFDPAAYRTAVPGSWAVGSSMSTKWLNSPAALIPLTALPLGISMWILVGTRRRRAGSVAAHG